jgi:hypothetical protein
MELSGFREDPEIRKHNYLLTNRFLSLPSQSDLTLMASKFRFLTFLNAHKQDSPQNCTNVSIEIIVLQDNKFLPLS